MSIRNAEVHSPFTHTSAFVDEQPVSGGQA
jgi:hypothetical protein